MPLNTLKRERFRNCESALATHVIQWNIEELLSIRLDSTTETRLDLLAKMTGRTKTFYVREAILEHLQDLEDTYLATHRLKNPAKTYSAEEVKHELGL